MANLQFSYDFCRVPIDIFESPPTPMKNSFVYFLFFREIFFLPLAGSLFAYFRIGYWGLSIFLCAAILFIVFLYKRFLDDPKKKQLYFYFNQGFTEFKLYGFAFVVNSLLILLIIYCYEAFGIG